MILELVGPFLHECALRRMAESALVVPFWQGQLSHTNGEWRGHLMEWRTSYHRGGHLLAVANQQGAARPIIPSQWGADRLSMVLGLQSSWLLWNSVVMWFMNIIQNLRCSKNIDSSMALGTSLGKDIMMDQEAARLSDISMVSGNCLDPTHQHSTALTGS